MVMDSSIVKSVPVVVASLFLGVVVGLISGKSYWVNIQPNVVSESSNVLTQMRTNNSDIFVSQTAVIQGKIVTINQKSLTVTGGNGKKDSFDILPELKIYSIKSGKNAPTIIPDISKLDLNRDMVVSLIFMENKYKVSAVSELDNTETKISTPSANIR